MWNVNCAEEDELPTNAQEDDKLEGFFKALLG